MQTHGINLLPYTPIMSHKALKHLNHCLCVCLLFRNLAPNTIAFNSVAMNKKAQWIIHTCSLCNLLNPLCIWKTPGTKIIERVGRVDIKRHCILSPWGTNNSQEKYTRKFYDLVYLGSFTSPLSHLTLSLLQIKSGF